LFAPQAEFDEPAVAVVNGGRRLFRLSLIDVFLKTLGAPRRVYSSVKVSLMALGCLGVSILANRRKRTGRFRIV
jgi:hypothetical protein